MAYYPRKYFSEPYYSPPNPDYSSYGPQYSSYLPTRRAYPAEPVESQPVPQLASIKTSNKNSYIINKRYKYYGYALIFLALASLAIEIANVVWTYYNFNVAAKLTTNALAVPYILTWIAPGIWGSVAVFVTGVLAVRVAGKNSKQVRVFALFCALCAFVFTPAIIGISIAEIITYSNLPDADKPNKICYSFTDANSLQCAKFYLPLIVAILGGIEFYLTFMVTIIFCCCWNPGGTTNTMRNTTGFSKPSFEDQLDPSADPYAIRPRPTVYYRSLPPLGEDPTLMPRRNFIAPNMDFLRSYPGYRPTAGRGFGFASAYNGQGYGYLPGATPAGPFYGSLPSLAGFGPPGPNPAYRVVYN